MGSRIQRLRSAIPAVLMTGVFSALLVIAAASQAHADVSYTSLERLGGDNRYDTMSMVVDEAYPSGTCDVAVVASGEKFPDALTASSLVGALDCPLITTNGEELSSEAKEQLERLGVKKVYILGDDNTISQYVERQIKGLADVVDVKRLMGETRVGTAIEIANEVRFIDPSSEFCIVTKSSTFPDALAISSWAAHTSTPIFFSEGGELSDETKDAIREGGYERVIVLGDDEGDDGISNNAVNDLGKYRIRLYGTDRYETAAQIVLWETGYYPSSPGAEDQLSYDGLAIASGEKFPDALASVSLTSVRGSALILANDNARTEYMAKEVLSEEAADINSAFVLGKSDSVSDKVYGWFSEALTKTTPLPDEDKPAIDDPAADDPVTDDPSADDPTGEDPSTDTPATGDPSEDDLTGEDPFDDNPAIDNPSEDTPATDDPSGEDPVTDQPSEDDPTTDTPSEGGSAGDALSTESSFEAR